MLYSVTPRVLDPVHILCCYSVTPRVLDPVLFCDIDPVLLFCDS